MKGGVGGLNRNDRFPSNRFLVARIKCLSWGDLAVRLFFKCFWCTNPFSPQNHACVRSERKEVREGERVPRTEPPSTRKTTSVVFPEVAMRHCPAGSDRTESKAGRAWQYATFPTKAYLWFKGHISRPCGPIFLRISPDRSTAAPV